VPGVVDITAATPRQTLLDALARPGTTVRLAADVNMDLSGLEDIRVAGGVTLTSEEPGQLGIARTTSALGGGPPVVSGRRGLSLGPRLFTTTRPRHLFSITCDGTSNADNVRFYGFRLQGPDLGIVNGDDKLEQGIYIESCLGIEIADLELSGWAGAAIYVAENSSARMDNPQAVHIHDNFIHDNQHLEEDGYGVDVSRGAWAWIERNVFDFNRHAITAYGDPGTGYRADLNLVLRGGGVNGKILNGQVHEFDVHGDKNCPDIPGNRHTWNCGDAGDQFWFTANSFQYTSDNAIKLRGTPRVQAVIDDNVFAHSSLDDAIAYTTGPANIVYQPTAGIAITPNQVGYDSFGRYGVCDFDADGKDDLFLPTGTTWWMSSAGRVQWTYLNRAHERLDKVLLGYFDGDQKCDVLTVDAGQVLISSGGTGDWTPLGVSAASIDELAVGSFGGGGRRPGDVFRRAPDGAWNVLLHGQHEWRTLESSSLPLSQLRLGDFTGDRVTDVLGVVGGRWAISRSGTGKWETLNAGLSDGLANVLVADVNGNGTDDVVRFDGDRWQVSWDGRGAWTTLAQPGSDGSSHVFAGHFTGNPKADLLLVDDGRLGRLYNSTTGAVGLQGLYPY
jgi:hypothetical protein